MSASLALAATLLLAPGWEIRDIGDAGISLKSPAPFALIASGADADAPQSVEKSVWRAESDDLTITVGYERWKTPHFAPGAALEIFARKSLGIPGGAIIQPAPIGGLSGALLLVTKANGVQRAVMRAKANDEAWQIDLAPKTGSIRLEILDDLRTSIRLAAPPETESYDAWGNVLAKINPDPGPKPLPSERQMLEGAKLSGVFPIQLEDRTLDRPEVEREAFEAISEWSGKGIASEVVVSYIRLKEGQRLDLGGWVASYGERLRDEGVQRFQPAIEEIKIGQALGRVVKGPASIGGRTVSIQIILLARKNECWAVQTRIHGSSAKAEEKALSNSLKILP